LEVRLKTRLLPVIVAAFAVTLGSSAPAIGVVTAAAQGEVAPATTVVSVVGDRDGFGYGLTDGQYRNLDFFDYRQLGDRDFTDVYPVRPATFSPRLAVFSYEHQGDLSLPAVAGKLSTGSQQPPEQHPG
jgi:hypothetical protein